MGYFWISVLLYLRLLMVCLGGVDCRFYSCRPHLRNVSSVLHRFMSRVALPGRTRVILCLRMFNRQRNVPWVVWALLTGDGVRSLKWIVKGASPCRLE